MGRESGFCGFDLGVLLEKGYTNTHNMRTRETYTHARTHTNAPRRAEYEADARCLVFFLHFPHLRLVRVRPEILLLQYTSQTLTPTKHISVYMLLFSAGAARPKGPQVNTARLLRVRVVSSYTFEAGAEKKKIPITIFTGWAKTSRLDQVSRYWTLYLTLCTCAIHACCYSVCLSSRPGSGGPRAWTSQGSGTTSCRTVKKAGNAQST